MDRMESRNVHIFYDRGRFSVHWSLIALCCPSCNKMGQWNEVFRLLEVLVDNKVCDLDDAGIERETKNFLLLGAQDPWYLEAVDDLKAAAKLGKVDSMIDGVTVIDGDFVKKVRLLELVGGSWKWNTVGVDESEWRERKELATKILEI